MTVTVDQLDRAIREGLTEARRHNAEGHIPTIAAYLLPRLLPLIQDDQAAGPSMQEVKDEIRKNGLTRVGDGAVMQDGRRVSNLVLVDALQSLWQEEKAQPAPEPASEPEPESSPPVTEPVITDPILSARRRSTRKKAA